MEAKNLADLYDLPVVEWSGVEARLAQGYPQAPGTGGPDRHSSWLATVNADGSPHVAGVGTMWEDGAFWIVTSEMSRKGRNLARDARCTVSVALQDYDVVVDGEAAKITDSPTLTKVAAMFAADGWPAEVDEAGTALTAPFSAPSAGPPPWHVYRITPCAATVLSIVEPGGATRWTF